ncbi:hypothetical protein KC356_g225 [Hortaea werneckii]|nr:hypothetical protein KC356_g225 [Hortaea werneckii]
MPPERTSSLAPTKEPIFPRPSMVTSTIRSQASKRPFSFCSSDWHCRRHLFRFCLRRRFQSHDLVLQGLTAGAETRLTNHSGLPSSSARPMIEPWYGPIPPENPSAILVIDMPPSAFLLALVIVSNLS